MKLSITVLTFIGFMLQTTLFADSSVTITITNNSHRTFEFDRAIVKYPGNKLVIDSKIIAPGQTAIIIGSAAPEAGLSGKLHFKSGAEFWVEVRRKIHYGRPVFSMHANNIKSVVTDEVFNQNGDARSLAYSAAWVTLSDR